MMSVEDIFRSTKLYQDLKKLDKRDLRFSSVLMYRYEVKLLRAESGHKDPEKTVIVQKDDFTKEITDLMLKNDRLKKELAGDRRLAFYNSISSGPHHSHAPNH